jgi:hypothetical protein
LAGSQALKAAGLYLKLSKYQFYGKRIRFIRFIIILDSIEMEPYRIRTVAEWLVPASYHVI